MTLEREYQSHNESTEPALRKAKLRPGEVLLAKFSGFDTQGQALVQYQGHPMQVAKTAIALEPNDAGRQVVVMFINEDCNQAIITGLVQSPLYDMISRSESKHEMIAEESDAEISASTVFEEETDLLSLQEKLTVDGKKVLIEGSEEVVLKCGEASITLTKAGKVLIRGKYLSSRSSGVNKILGGSVQVN